MSTPKEQVTDPVNEVVLRGRVSGEPKERVLPSGDLLVTFRVVVPRSAKARRRSKVTVDVFDCVAWSASMRRAVSRLALDDVVEITGELRRRFQRSAGLPTSRVDVEVTGCHKVSARRSRTAPIVA